MYSTHFNERKRHLTKSEYSPLQLISLAMDLLYKVLKMLDLSISNIFIIKIFINQYFNIK